MVSLLVKKNYYIILKSTCSPEPCVAVDRHLSLLQSKGHHLHHVQHSGEVGHAVVTPAKIVKIN